MRLSNCSAPIPPHGQPRGQMKNLCDKKGGVLQNKVKKGGALQNEGIIVINQGGTRKKCSDKKTGATQIKVMSPGCPGG